MLKTLREDGFKVTLFERRSQVGGVWAYTDDKSFTTALPSWYAHAECVTPAKKCSHIGKHQQIYLRHV
jgi:cation diffusion facilitator CzcD-associated flavoprotein CzcO